MLFIKATAQIRNYGITVTRHIKIGQYESIKMGTDRSIKIHPQQSVAGHYYGPL